MNWLQAKLGIKKLCFSFAPSTSLTQLKQAYHCGVKPLNRLMHGTSANRDYDPAWWNKKISFFVRNGQLNNARHVFDKMPQRNVVSWNSLISGYVKSREIMQARKLFDEMPERDVVSWNLMISGYAIKGGSSKLEEGRCLFDQMPFRDLVSWNTMITGYARSGRMVDALQLFEEMPQKSVVSWNAMITGYLQNGDVSTAVEFFEKMPAPDSASLNTLVSGYMQNGRLDEAAAFLFNRKHMVDEGDLVYAYNTLIAGYGQSGRVEEARQLFDQIPMPDDGNNNNLGEQQRIKNRRINSVRKFERDIVSWNSMLMCYVKAGKTTLARQLFDEMAQRDSISWNTMLSCYVHVSDMEEAARLFHKMPQPDTYTWNSMISGYAHNGKLELARDFFERMPQKNLVSWNSIIAGYEQNSDYEGAITLFSCMQKMGQKPDRHTLSSILSACAGVVAIYQGKQIHQLIVKTVVADIPINNSLITMYSRCGNIEDAIEVFDKMSHREVVSWNAIIGGHAQHGLAKEALLLFERMKEMAVKPTRITFVSVLNACAHAGLVREAQKVFSSMIYEYGIVPGVEHFASLVDVLCRHGKLEDAMDLIRTMPVEPDRAVWGALLSGSRVHGNMDMAETAAQALIKLEPESSAPYVMLSNMHADEGRWDAALELREMMDKNGVRKQAGYSWIELQNRVHVFTSGDRWHPLAEEICEVIESVNRCIKDLYYTGSII